MARGRMISNTLGSSRSFLRVKQYMEDKKAGELTDFARLLFVLLVVNSDDFGRLEGDALTVKLRVFPASERDEREFALALEALHRSGLIVWYKADDQHIVEICQFSQHQTGLHKRTKSRFPDPPVKPREKRRLSQNLDRHDRLCQTYERLFKKIKKQPYLATDEQRARDSKAAKELCLAYGDEDISRIAEQFLSLPDDHPKIKQWEGQSRTVPMLLRVAASIAEALGIQGVVA
tara:strand:- start:319 stop:1017 length:699 start_codon:yes stop_codon:yes gene_type:complete